MLGKLSWSAIPFNQPIPLITSMVVILIVVSVLGWVTIKGYWPYLWREWITSVDHKRIGVMYCLLGVLMLIRGFADAIMMRSQQALAIGGAPGYLPPEHYNQIFTAHGTIMIFFGAMPLVIGLMNYVMPLQLGVRDVAFPTLNSVGFWLTATGALLINLSLFIGEFARTGWLPYPPLSESQLHPRRRRRLLPVGGTDLRHRHADHRDKPCHHRAEDARPGHELSAHADVLLDHARLQPADHRRLPGADRLPGDADPRPIPGLPFLH